MLLLRLFGGLFAAVLAAVLASGVVAAGAAPPGATFVVPGPIVAEAQDASGAEVSYTVTATNGAGKARAIECSYPAGSTGSGTLSVTARFPLGVTTVTCSALDGDGTVAASGSFTVTVRDTTPPHVASIADLAVTATGAAGAVVSFDAPSAVDAVDGPVPVECNPSSGSTFALGTTTVSCSATDAHGNTGTTTFHVTVSLASVPSPSPPPAPAPPAPTPAPPSAVDRTPPHDVADVAVKAEARLVELDWVLPGDTDFAKVEITRFEQTGSPATLVYSGNSTRLVDRNVANNVRYRYLIVAVDQAGNRSAGVTVLATPKADLLLSPRDRASVKKPPRLVWAPSSGATYYNVQMFRAGKKIFSAWPRTARLQLRRTWRYRGHRYRLTRGAYTWYVWPAIGTRADANYGPMLGTSTFRVTR